MKKWHAVLATGLVALCLSAPVSVASAADSSAGNDKLKSKVAESPDKTQKNKVNSPKEKAKSADAPKAKIDKNKTNQKEQKKWGDPHVDGKTR